VVSNPDIKKQIRIAAEEEELESYESRMSRIGWKTKPLGQTGTNPFRNTTLIIVFRRIYEFDTDGKRKTIITFRKVGATGFLLAAIHNAGLLVDPYPSPMNFISKILNRPANENPSY
jgi:hypothetical protein